MNKLIPLFLLLVFLSTQVINAQVSLYTFGQTSGTYTPITGGTVIAEANATSGVGSLDDVIYTLPEGTIPFDFYFSGTLFTGFKVSSNGFITFGDVLPATTTYVPISATLGYNGAASPMGRDLQGIYGTTGDRTLDSPVLTNVANFTGVEVGKFITGTGIPGTTTVPTTTILSFDVGAQTITMSDNAISTGTNTTLAIASGEIRYEVLGTAPNRIFVIQFKNFRKFAAVTDNFNFQIRLHESTYKIEYVYGPFVSNTTSTTIQVGLRGSANTDFFNRTSATDWSATTPGGTNTASVTLTNLVFPPSGLTFEFNSPNFPPAIVYSPLLNTALTGNRTLSNVEINDPNVVATGALAPRIYWRVNAGSWQSSPTSQTSNPYSFTISTTGLVVGDVVDYFVVAQDLLGAVGANPSTGFSAVDVNNITTPPTTPYSYTISPTLSGTYTVGTGENYANLTAVAAALNSRVVTGNVIFELTNNYDGTTGETLPIQLNEFVSEAPALTNYTVTIRPALGVTNRVTSGDPGSGFSLGVINFNGGDYYILDGRPGGVGDSKEWTLRNTRTAASIGPVVRFVDGAKLNQVQYLNLESQATLTTTGVVFFHTSTASDGNSYNSINNNNIRGRTDVASAMSNGILSNGTATAPNTHNYIGGNHIYNFNNIGASILTTGNGPDWVFYQNHFYNSTVSTSAQTGINIASATTTNSLIVENFIGGDAPGATGTWSNSGAGVIITGIIVSNGVVEIRDNTIANITQTGTGTGARLRGIYITSANDGNEIIGNNIYNLITSSTGTGLAAAAQPVWGIGVFTGSTFYKTDVIGNKIYNLIADNNFANTTSNVACGMFLTNVGTGSIVANNQVYDIKNKATGITANQPPIAAGIFIRFIQTPGIYNNMISLGFGENTNTQFAGIMVVAGVAANLNPYIYNSIAIGGTSGGTNSSFGILRGDNTAVSVGSTINLYNNVVVNTRSGGGSLNFAVGSQGSDATLNFVSNYNAFYSSDTNNIGFLNDTAYTFSGWKTKTSGDANSVSKEVLFVNAANGDLHLTGASVGDLDLSGTPIVGITTDFDGDERNSVAPYMGADEADVPLYQPPIITLWERSVADASLPTWFGTNTERGIAYGLTQASPSLTTNERVFVVSRSDGIKIRILNAATGADVGELNTTGITGGTFALNDVEVSSDGIIFANNLTLNASTDPFKIYMWANEGSVPAVVFSYTAADAVRLGDNFSVVGNYLAGTAQIWAASATAGQGKIYKWTMTGGSFNAVPEIITLSDNAAGGSAAVGPLANGDFYWNAGGHSAKKYSANGTLIGTIPGGVVATGSNAIVFLGSIGTDEYVATYQYGAGNHNARVVQVPNGVPEDATTYGLTTSMGSAANVGGTGDVAVKHNPDGSKDIFVVATNNGVGAYRSTQSIPVELGLFTAVADGRDVMLNWRTLTESNTAGFEVERRNNNEWQKVGYVQAAGNSTEPVNYSYSDSKLDVGTYGYRLRIVDLDGTFTYSPEVEVEVGVPMVYAMSQNYPNPFNPATRISYQVPMNAKVTITLYSITGERVAMLVNEELTAGYYSLDVDASSLRLASGVYLYRMIATDLNGGKFNDVKKMMMIK